MKICWKILPSLIFLLGVIIILMFIFRPSRQITIYSLPLCQIKTEGAVKDLVQRDFPGSWNKFSNSLIAMVITVNDMRCEPEASMANFGIILEDKQKTLFGIFHVHFSREGTFISSAAITPWTQVSDRNDPQVDSLWRDFIKTVYPEETKKPG